MAEATIGIFGGNSPENGRNSSDIHNRVALLETEIAALKARQLENTTKVGGVSTVVKKGDSVCLVVFSGTLDRLLAAMNIATGAAAMGCEVSLFFTFWGTAALRKGGFRGERPFIEKMFGWMLPSGADQVQLSTMKWGGLGTRMIRWRMKKKNVATLNALYGMARELGVRFVVCEMSMDLMGIKFDDLIEYPGMERAGVATFMGQALNANVTLFV